MMFGRGYNGIGNCFGYGSGFMYGGWGMIIMAAFAVLAVIAIVYFTRRAGRSQTKNSAIEALNMRFAKGEITEEEYLKRKDILNS